MSLLHLYLVTDLDRKHAGSIEVPNARSLMPAGLELTTEMAMTSILTVGENQRWTAQDTDDAGLLLYEFSVAPCHRGESRPAKHLH